MGWLSAFSRIFTTGRNLPGNIASLHWLDCEFMAIDLELTSLNPKDSAITSVGWAEGKAGKMALNQCEHHVVMTFAPLNQSPVIHGLTQAHLKAGKPLLYCLQTLLEKGRDKIWVFHNANLDWAVLHRQFQQHGLRIPQVIIFDTLQFAVYQLAKQHQVLPSQSASLTVCRQRLGLPLATAHDALEDAFATLQLVFAQLYEFDPKAQLRLGELLHTGAIRYVSA